VCFSARNKFQLLQERQSINEESTACLITTKPMHEADSLTAANMQQLLERCAIYYWGGEGMKFLDCACNVLQPLRFTRHDAKAIT
jgi:hypothetical protein